MEAKEGRPSGRSQKEQKPAKGSLQTRFKDSWLGRNWGTILVLVAVIFIALFVRSYFGFSTAVDNGFLVGGGSDSYYHMRVIEHVENTGSHLVTDPLLDYPMGIRNMRPPVYDWSVAVTSMFISGVSGVSLTDSTGYTLLFSTAFWGALTCIPVFLLTRAAFGNRAGLLASFLFALMPGNITRSVFADADHDAIILFFVVFALYFLLRALMSINGTKWVSSWTSPKTIRPGLMSYISGNKSSLIYAMLGGVCISLVAMTWTGYTYILVIILVYFLVQILINRFRNIDSMGEFFVIGAMLMTAFVLMAPLYWQMNYWGQWFDVPFYLFIGAMLVGGIFMVTRDYPWTLVLPAIVAMIAIGMVAIFFIAPNIFEAIISGQGYLVKSKLYSTIQEAQAPTFSDLALSFGAVTFWFALIGVVWAAVKIPKNPSPYLVFIVVWLGVSIYMAASAGRFMFNASPAFAMAAGWILALLIAMFKFDEVPRAFGGFLSNPWTTIKKAVKLRHVAGVLFLAFLIVLPNAWGAIDAGIPSEIKRDYDKQIYYALPDILHPSSYDRINGSFWYLGAFSYSLPLPDTYYPAAWSWFKTQDSDLAAEDKPAYLSWWDYGFEAAQQGEHPTVADNFQNGYQFAGSFLMAENESDAVAMFIIRILEKAGFNSTTMAILEDNGVNASAVQDIMQNPANYVQTVLDNPGLYGNFSSDLSAANAKYAAARIELEKVGLESLVDIYHDIRVASGYDIGYVAVDSRLFPFSATSSNIFYAPAKLSDRVIDPTTNAPTNYFSIKAVVQDPFTGEYGVIEVKDVTSQDNVVAYQIYYTDVFYETMLYRTFMGLSPKDVGATSQGIPGISGSMTNYNAMPAFNLTHFKQVYRTAYFNPYNSSDLVNHSDAWKAVSYEEAQYLQAEITAGNITGTVDMSSASLESGVVFIQYYDGAMLEGKATSTDGTPYSGIYVTVVDENGIPHHTVRTASDGSYSVYLPFGDISVVYSAGTPTKGTQIATEIARENYTVSYAQAQRLEPFNADGDITLPGSSVSGTVFWDMNGDGRYSPGDQYISGATVTLENNATGFKAEATTGTNGAYSLVGLAGNDNHLYATYNGHQFGDQTFNMVAYGSLTKAITAKPAAIDGTLTFSNGDPAAGVAISLTDKATGKVTNTTSGSGGKFLFDRLLPGEYTVSTSDPDLSVDTQTYTLAAGQTLTPTLAMFSATQVSGTVTIEGETQANVAVEFISGSRDVFATTDSNGQYSITLPQDTYTVYALNIRDGMDYVAMVPFVADENVETLNLSLATGSVVTGTVRDGSNAVSGATVIYTATADGTFLKGTTNSTGGYRLVLPANNYFVYAKSSNKAFWGTSSITGSTVLDLGLQDSVSIAGKTYYDANGNSVVDSGETIANAVLRLQSNISSDHVVYFQTDSTGSFTIPLPKGNGYLLTVTKDGYGTWTNGYEPLNENRQETIQLPANNRTVTGSVDVGEGVTVSFQPQGNIGQAASVVTGTNGAFSLSLKPGAYNVIIDQNVVPGDDSRKYQYNGALTVSVGRDPAAMSIIATERVKVDGSVSMSGSSGSIRFIGPDDKTLNVSSAFPLYLVPGDYSVYVDVVSGGKHYVNLSSQTIAAGSSLTITPLEARTLTGQLQYDGTDLKVPAAITITQGSASYALSANNQGIFVAHLVPGTYTVEAEYHTQASVNGTTRYVVYTADQSVTLTGDRSQDFILDQVLDTVTLSGTISGASPTTSWTFTALDSTGTDATMTSGTGPYTISLAPGLYSVYGIDGTNVYMGAVTVPANKDTTANLTLTPGIAVTGTVNYNGAPVSGATVVFSNSAMRTVTTDGSGNYVAYLPAGVYNVSANWVQEEVAGVNVTYARSFDLDLASEVTRDIPLVRQLKGAVELRWDSTTQREVNAGESVTYDVTITNRGNVDDTYKLSSTSAWGVTFSQDTVHLPVPGSSTTIQVTIKTPADAKVVHSAIKINAVSQNNTAAQGSVNLDVDIVPTYGVSVSLGSSEVVDQNSYTYPFLIKNTGNSADSFNVTLSQEMIDALAVQGWDATIAGESVPYKVVSVSAGSTQTVNVILTKNRESPEVNVSVSVDVSSSHSSTSANFPLEKGSFTDPSLTVSGNGASMNAPQIPASSWFLIAMIMLSIVALVVLRVNKGVFGRRRKR